MLCVALCLLPYSVLIGSSQDGPTPRFVVDLPRAKLVPRLLRERTASIAAFRDTKREGWRDSIVISQEGVQ